MAASPEGHHCLVGGHVPQSEGPVLTPGCQQPALPAQAHSTHLLLPVAMENPDLDHVQTNHNDQSRAS